MRSVLTLVGGAVRGAAGLLRPGVLVIAVAALLFVCSGAFAAISYKINGTEPYQGETYNRNQQIYGWGTWGAWLVSTSADHTSYTLDIINCMGAPVLGSPVDLQIPGCTWDVSHGAWVSYHATETTLAPGTAGMYTAGNCVTALEQEPRRWTSRHPHYLVH